MTSEAGSAAPGNDVESPPPERRRTVWVWVILAYTLLALVGTALLTAAALIGFWPSLVSTVPLSPLFYAVAVVSVVLYFVGALALFNLRARAVPLLALGLVCNVIEMLIMRSEGWGELPDGAPGAEPGRQLLAASAEVFGLLVFAAILAYAVRLRWRGVLR